MPIIFTWTNHIYAWIDSILQNVTNQYGVAILFALFYFIVIKLTTTKLQQREYEKRKLILEDMKQLPSEVPQTKGAKGWFNTEPTEEDENKRMEQIDIVKKHNGKPGRIITAMLIQGLVFASFIVYFSTQKSVPHVAVMPVIAVILSLLAYVTRKTIIINLIFVPIVYYASAHLSGLANIFYDAVFIFYIVERIYKYTKSKIKKSPKTV